MILINLLPHRQQRRRQRKIAFFAGISASVAAGLAVAGVWYLVLSHTISTQQARNAFLIAEIKILEAQIRDIATLNQDLDALKARQKAVEDLQVERNMPVRLLGELARNTPDGVYLVSVKQSGNQVSVSGLAQSNERVSEFLRNVSSQSLWLHQPELQEIRLAAPNASGRDTKRLFEFSMRVALKPPVQIDTGGAGDAAPGRSS